MTAGRLDSILHSLCGPLARHQVGEVQDGELLDLFLDRRDEAAFAELVRRHGPMVLGVCRRVLGNRDDAEDAFQATFLVLVRRGHSIRPRGRVGPFLHGVAHRTALAARRDLARRRLQEARVMPRSEQPADTPADLGSILDEELSRLPERYRAPLVLCDLEGRTRKEVAGLLGWAEGTVSSRLSRARALLARRLTRRGLGFSAGALAAVLTPEAATANVPATLAVSTTRAALLVAAGQAVAPGLLGASAASLAERMVKVMWWMKVRTAVAVLLATTLAGAAALKVLAAPPAKEEPAPARAPVVQPAAEEKPDPVAARADGISVKELPPVVVKTVPASGDTKVDAAKIKEIRVTFSKDMMDKSWTWSQLSADTFPKIAGKVRFEKDQRTCVLPVKLEAGKTYAIWLNSEKFKNFKDSDGNEAVPYLLVFETKP